MGALLKLRISAGQVTAVADEEISSLTTDQLIERHALNARSPGHTLHFSPVPCKGCKESLERFRQVGMLLGYGLLCNVPVPIIFYRHVYKYLLQRPVSLADMLYTDKDAAERLSGYLQKAELFRTGRPDGEDPQTWDNVFETEDGEIMRDANGEEILVTMSNLNAFVRWDVAKRLTLPIKQELEAMRQGLLLIVPESLLTGLTAEDLQMLLSGRSVLPTIADLKKFITIVDKRTPLQQAELLSQAEAEGRIPDEWITKDDFEGVFWEMTELLEPSEYIDFVDYVTGSPVLHSQMEIQVSDPPENMMSGPFARQCMSSLRVPCCVWSQNSPKSFERLTAPVLLQIFRSEMTLAREIGFDVV